MKKILYVAATVLSALTVSHAADGRIPIYEAPFTITEPGSYYLSRDITHEGPGSALVIESSNVTIDLEGHTLEMQDENYNNINSFGNYTNIRIENGTVEGGGIGIKVSNSSGGKDLTVRLTDLLVTGARTEAIKVFANASTNNARVYIARNILKDNGREGIELTNVTDGIVSDNVIAEVSAGVADVPGIRLTNCDALKISRNSVSKFTGNGIHAYNINGIVFEENSLSRNTGAGLWMDGAQYVALRGNTAVFNGGGGLIYTTNIANYFDDGQNYPDPQPE